MKKYSPLIIAIISVIIRFIYFWFHDEIYDSILIFLFPFIAILFLVLPTISLCQSFERLPKDRSWINISAAIISIFSIIMFFIIPFRDLKTKADIKFYERDMLKIVEHVKNNDWEDDGIGNITLPKDFKHLSNSGQVTVLKNDEEGQVIIFWIYRGMLSGSTELIYSSGGEKMIKDNETGHPITSIERVKDNWYYVETDY